MAHDVFISYSSKDKPVADAVVAALEARGVRCWVAPRDIPPGADYGGAIIEGINGSRVMVLIFSGNSNASPQVVREVERAVNKQLHIIPFRIEPAEMTKAMEYYISSPHWLDAITPPLEGHIDRLAETVRAVVGDSAAAVRPSVTEPKPKSVPTTPSPARHSTGVLLVAGVLLIALAAGGGFVWYRFHGSRGSVTPHSPVQATTTPTTGGVATAAGPARSSEALLALPATDGLVRRFELTADDEPGSMGRLFLSPDGSRLVAGPHDNERGIPSAAAWDTVSGRPLFRVKGVHAMAVSSDAGKVFLATRWEGGGVRDVATGAKLSAIDVAQPGVIAEWAHDGHALAVGGGGKLALFDPDGVKVRDLAGESTEGDLWRIRFAPDDQFLLLASTFSSQVECRSPRTGALLWSRDAAVPRAMTQFAATAYRVCVSRDRTWVLDAKTGKPLVNLNASWNDTIFDLSPDGAWLAGVDREGTGGPVKLWAVDGQQELSRFNTVSVAKPTSLRFTPDGRRLLVGTIDGHLLVFDVASGQQVADRKASPSSVLEMSCSADGRFAVTNGGDGNVAWLWRMPE